MIVESNLKMNTQTSSTSGFYVPPTINGATTTAIIVAAISAKRKSRSRVIFMSFFIYTYYRYIFICILMISFDN